jgi:signal transduction histidine kinase/DNA-binding response OmpR family regulator
VALKEGLKVYDATKNILTGVNFPGIRSNPYAIKDVYHLTAERQSFVTLDGGGLYKLGESLQVTAFYQTNEDDLTTLSNNAAYDILVDSYNRLWVTTYGGGVNVAAPDLQPFNNIFHEANNSNSLSNNAAKAFTEDGAGHHWFGTRKGLSKFNRLSINWVHFNEEQYGSAFSNDNVLALSGNGKDVIWAGTYGGGIIQINTGNNQIKNYSNNPSDSNSIGSDYIYALLYDSKKRLWAGGIRGPLSYLDHVTNTFIRINTNAAAINCIIESSGGDILVGAEKGILKVNGKKLESLLPQIITDKVLCILEDSPGNYWVGTQGGGLLFVNTRNGIEKKYKSAEGLPSDVICGLVKDNNGNLWIGTSRGLAQYVKKSNFFTVYTKADGLAGSQVNYGAVFKNSKGEIIVGTTEGFSLFNPQRINIKGFAPKIVLTGLSVNNKQISPEDPTEILPVQIDELEKLKFKHYQNSFAIDFVNTSPALAGKHLYSWKLDGYDKEWSQPSTLSTASYTNLKSGNYILVIKTFLKGQQENAVERRLPIKITAPWWLTGWAFAGYTLLLAGVLLTIYNFVKIKQGRLRYAERLKLNTSISHEIRTPLTLIKGPVSTLSSSGHLSEADKNNLALAQKNIEKLEKIISQFIDYQKTGLQKMQMQVVKADIVKLLDDVTASFIPLMKEKNIHFAYKKPSEETPLLFDKDKMEKVFNNLLSNAVKYTPALHDIEVAVSKDSKELVIAVADTGIGIPAAQQRFIFNGYFRADNTVNLKETGSGIGLNVAKELVEMHKGKLEFRSEAGKRTVFTVRLPLYNEALKTYLIKDKAGQDGTDIPVITEASPKQSTNKRILIAEDNDELRTYLKNELSSAGYKITEAGNGQIAWAYLKKQTVDLIITDVMMPEMNGFQLCGAVKKELNTCHIPVIMLTAIHDKDYMLEGYRSGADDFVRKPFDLAHIIVRIENLLQNRTRFKAKIMSVFEQEKEVVENDADMDWLKKVTDIITDQMAEPGFSVEKLCRSMALSRPVLFRKFKAITGDSPQTYINQIRLRRAVELLQLGRMNINEVAFECGFGDPKYFSTAFKKHFGKTPTDYLKTPATKD